MKRLERLLKPFFHRYDIDKNGTLEFSELAMVFTDMGESINKKELLKFFPSSHASVHYNEFVQGVAAYLLTHENLVVNHINKEVEVENGNNGATEEGDESDDEEEDMPEDLVCI